MTARNISSSPLRMAFAAVCLMLCPAPAALAFDFPTEIARAEVDSTARKYDCEKVRIEGGCPGLLLTPRGTLKYSDGKYHQSYHAASHVYVVDPAASAGYTQRFMVYGVGEESKSEMMRVARLLVTLWNDEFTRLKHDHAPDEPTVEVWLSQQRGAGLSPDTGGEQFKNQIYIYDVQRARLQVEWAREVAHEYGHYALPGISGFKEPEEWANGVLGERLYLKWIADDLRAGKLLPSALPYITPTELDEYIAKQVDPLIRRVAAEGITTAQLARRDTAGMDNYTGLALYIDHYYGSAQLLRAMSYTSPAHRDVFAEAPDFLRGFLASMNAGTEIKIKVPVEAAAGGQTHVLHMIYLAAGQYTIEQSSATLSWQISIAGTPIPRKSSERIRLVRNGWYSITMRTPPAGSEHLVLTRSPINPKD